MYQASWPKVPVNTPAVVSGCHRCSSASEPASSGATFPLNVARRLRAPLARAARQPLEHRWRAARALHPHRISLGQRTGLLLVAMYPMDLSREDCPEIANFCRFAFLIKGGRPVPTAHAPPSGARRARARPPPGCVARASCFPFNSVKTRRQVADQVMPCLVVLRGRSQKSCCIAQQILCRSMFSQTGPTLVAQVLSYPGRLTDRIWAKWASVFQDKSTRGIDEIWGPVQPSLARV